MSVSYFLGKTALTEFWDKTAEKIVFLGAWCLRYDREGDWQGLNHEILPHPWDDRRAMHQAARLEEELYEEMLPLLGEFLNEAHGEKHREQYWRIILGPWLLHYIQVLHERYLCLKLALERYPNIQTMGLADSSFRIPRFFWDHLHGCTDDPYNLQLYTVILKAMGYPPPTREYNWGWEDSTPSMPGSSGPLWKRLGRRLKPLWRQCESLWGKRAPILLVDMYLPMEQVLQLMVSTGFRACWCQLPEPEKWVNSGTSLNLHPRRHDLDSLVLKKNDPFRSVLIKTLSRHFPLMYLEGYSVCREWVRQEWEKSGTKAVLTANASFGNETFKVLAATLQEQGAKLIEIQHGGSCGTARYNPVEDLQRKYANEFWSWGWGKGEKGVTPMPNPKLSRLAQRRNHLRKTNNPYIFYVGNMIPRYHYRTWSCPTAQQAIPYIHWQIRFLKALGGDIRAKLLFRPYPHDYGWALRQRLKEAWPGLRLDNPQDDYYKGLVGASLVVCDMNQTTLLESLAANIPTIAFWDPHFCELRPEAEPYFQGLRQAGILYHDPVEAAAALQGLWPQIESWWEQEAVQQARQQFVQEFALNTPGWVSAWREQLLKNC